MPGPSPGGLQQAPTMAPSGWHAMGLTQPSQAPAAGGAPPASYQISNPGLGPAGSSYVPRTYQPFQSHIDLIPPNHVLPKQFGPPMVPTVAQQPFFNPDMSAVEQHHAKSVVTSLGGDPFFLADERQSSCCSSEKPDDWKYTGPSENQNLMSEMLMSSPQTTIYHIPANHATYNNPLKPDPQPKFSQSNSDYGQTVPAYAESGVIGTAALPAETNDTTGCIVATTHHCHCGSTCQCIACPVHPGNATTQAKVAEMHNLLDNEPPYTPTFEANPSGPSSHRTNENIATPSYQVYDFQMLSNGKEHRSQIDLVSLQHGQHWMPQVSSSQEQFPPRDSDPRNVSYTHGIAGMNNPNGENNRLSATPSQDYLHFQYPLPYVDE